MPNLIELLLENADQLASRGMKSGTTIPLDTQAIVLSNQSLIGGPFWMSTGSSESSSSESSESKLNRLLVAELAQFNLCDSGLYRRILQAIPMWQPAPLSALSETSCQKVRQAVWKLLPDIRKKQQLDAECHQYKQHLKTDIEDQLCNDHPQLYKQYISNQKLKGVPLAGSGRLPALYTQPGKNMERFAATYPQGVPNGSQSLNRALQKYAAVDSLHQILMTPKPISGQLTDFSQALKTQQSILEKDRDSFAMKFLKGVATVLSLGIAALCGIWDVRGKTAAEAMQGSLASPSSLPPLATSSASFSH